MPKLIVITDPFPRTIDLIFTKKKFKELKSNYKTITAPKNNKKNFYEKNIHKALANDFKYKEALIFANKVAGISTTRLGAASSMPFLTEVEGY